MKRYRLNKRILCVLMLCSLMMAVGSASAFFPQSDEVKWFSANGAPRYDASEVNAKGEIFWTIDGILPAYPKLIKQITLDDGKVSEWQLDAGYIIQSDSAEYNDGFLYAIENATDVEIWHVTLNGEKTLLRTCSIPIPLGQQTVRAYMHGDLYYIKVLEENTTPVYNRKAALCRLSETGEEYQYALNNYEKVHEKEYVELIHCYAINENGNVAWANGQGIFDTNPCHSISVETMGKGVSVYLNKEVLNDIGCECIEGRCIAWWDDATLLFAAFDADAQIRLYKLKLDTGSIEVVMNDRGEPVYLSHWIVRGSNIVLNAERTFLLYMGLPNRWQDALSESAMLNASVPIMIDLRSGTTYILYENKAKADDPNSLYEVRDNAGQLAYVETD